ncbi:hypothetical protein GCM10027020_34000 [Nocardioides salsibiostraticola]
MSDLRVSAEALRTFANAGRDVDDEVSDLIATALGAELSSALDGSQTGVTATGIGGTGREALSAVGGRFATIADRVTSAAEDYSTTDDHVGTRFGLGPR